MKLRLYLVTFINIMLLVPAMYAMEPLAKDVVMVCKPDGSCQKDTTPSYKIDDIIAEYAKNPNAISARYLLDLSKKRSSRYPYTVHPYPSYLESLFGGYSSLLINVFNNEIKYGDDYFAFYNARSGAINFCYYIIGQLNRIFSHKYKTARFGSPAEFEDITAKQYVTKAFDERYNRYAPQYEQKLGTWDHQLNITKNLLSASLTLENGTGGEAAWQFFKQNTNIATMGASFGSSQDKLIAAILREYFVKLGLPIERIIPYVRLFQEYETLLEAQLLQIFIKKDIAQQLVYIALPGGNPLLTADVRSFLEGYVENADSQEKLLNMATEFSPNFWFYLSKESLLQEGIGAIQARIYIKNRLFYNNSIVKIIEYYGPNSNLNSVREYRRKVKKLVKEDIDFLRKQKQMTTPSGNVQRLHTN